MPYEAVDFDPFAQQPSDNFEPVDYDPFAESERKSFGDYAFEKLAEGGEVIQNIGVGGISALGRMGTGLIQRASEIVGDEDVRIAAGGVKRTLDRLDAEAGTGSGVGQFVGRVAPAVGMGLIGGSGFFGLSEPTDEPSRLASIEEAAKNTAISTGTGVATAGILKGAGMGINAGRKALGKALGVSGERVAQIEGAGLPINLPAASDSASVKTLANMSAQLPGGKAISKSMEAAYQQADDALKALGYTGKTTPSMAGNTVHGAFGRWRSTGKARFKAVDDALQKMVPDTSPAIADDITSRVRSIVTAPGLTESQLAARANLPAVRYLTGLADDAALNGGNISYGALKEARTRVGALLEQGLVKNIDDALADKVYGQLTDMMRESVRRNAGERGVKAFDLRNKIYSRFIDEKKNFISKLEKKLGDEPEKIFTNLTSGEKVGASKAARIMSKLNTAERDAVRDALIFQKGGGENFTISKWVNEYQKMSPEAKQVFFSGRKELREAHDALVKGLQNYKDVGKFGNPSRSGIFNMFTALIGGAGVGGGIAGGVSGSAGALAGGYGFNRALSGLMASPRFVKWLAGSSKITTDKALTKYLDKAPAEAKAMLDDFLPPLGGSGSIDDAARMGGNIPGSVPAGAAGSSIQRGEPTLIQRGKELLRDQSGSVGGGKLPRKDLRSLNTSVYDSYGGEHFGEKLIYKGDELVGAANISVLPGQAHITNIVSKEGMRRQGIASQLMDDVFKEFPDRKIYITNMTDDGAKFFKKKYNILDDGQITPKNSSLLLDSLVPPSVGIGAAGALGAGEGNAGEPVPINPETGRPVITIRPPRQEVPGPQSEFTRQNEGLRFSAYDDTTGNRTVGVGFNMDSGIAKRTWKQAGVQASFDDVYKGRADISPEEAEALYAASGKIAAQDAITFLPEVSKMSPGRQQAVLDLSYQLGLPSLQKFSKFKSAMKDGNYKLAARELANSEYFKQTPKRARRVIEMIVRG